MSYVVINIDTTNPTISIYAPNYTTQDVVNTITIEADEPIADYQEIYLIDSLSNRYDYTFAKEADNQYVGRIRFNNLPLGVHTMYARVKDEVNNFSNIAVKQIEIKESLNKGNVTVSSREFNKVDVSDFDMGEVSISDRKMAEVGIRDYNSNKGGVADGN